MYYVRICAKKLKDNHVTPAITQQHIHQHQCKTIYNKIAINCNSALVVDMQKDTNCIFANFVKLSQQRTYFEIPKFPFMRFSIF